MVKISVHILLWGMPNMAGSARASILGLVTLSALFFASPTHAESITVFAAVSLKETLESAGEAFSSETGIKIQYSFASSSVLAKQIETGAPADVFASADRKWMDYLDTRQLLRRDTRVNLVGNALVVIASKLSRRDQITFTPGAFSEALGQSRLAIAEVNTVPAGIYAKAAFEHFGLWAEIEPKLAQTENVRAALAFVARGEAELGIVYATDARVESSVKVIATIPAGSHEPIVYPFAVTSASKSASARRFLEFLQGPVARKIFENAGFVFLK